MFSRTADRMTEANLVGFLRLTDCGPCGSADGGPHRPTDHGSGYGPRSGLLFDGLATGRETQNGGSDAADLNDAGHVEFHSG